MKEYYNDFLKSELSLVDAYVQCWNDLRICHHSGVYGGKEHDLLEHDLSELQSHIITEWIFQHGFRKEATKYGYSQYEHW